MALERQRQIAIVGLQWLAQTESIWLRPKIAPSLCWFSFRRNQKGIPYFVGHAKSGGILPDVFGAFGAGNKGP